MDIRLPFSYSAGPAFSLKAGMAFGGHWNSLDPKFFPPNVSILRSWDDGTRWALVNPAPGVYVWTIMDQRVAAATRAGADLVYVIGCAPAWAVLSTTGAPASAWPDAPKGNWPADPVALGTFVKALVTRYPTIKVIETMNEFNSPRFSCATKTQLFINQEVIWTEAKAANPGILITTPTPCWAQTCVDVEIDSLLTLGFAQWADIITFHGYQAPGKPALAYEPTLQAITAAMAKHGCTLPLWDTEYGFGGSAGGDAAFTPDQQYAWVVDSLMLRWIYNVKAAIWYGNPTHNPQFNLDGTRNPAGKAWDDVCRRVGP